MRDRNLLISYKNAHTNWKSFLTNLGSGELLTKEKMTKYKNLLCALGEAKREWHSSIS